MTQFTVRVELHEADWDDYEALHEEMHKEGFSSAITGSDGKTYQLPTAEYGYEGDVTRDQLLDKAIAAANRVHRHFGILITKSAGRTWYGLK